MVTSVGPHTGVACGEAWGGGQKPRAERTATSKKPWYACSELVGSISGKSRASSAVVRDPIAPRSNTKRIGGKTKFKGDRARWTEPFHTTKAPHTTTIRTSSTMQEESLQPITVGAFYGLQCPRPFLLACENPPTEEGPDTRKPPSLKDSPYYALAGQNSVFLGRQPPQSPSAPFAMATLRG